MRPPQPRKVQWLAYVVAAIGMLVVVWAIMHWFTRGMVMSDDMQEDIAAFLLKQDIRRAATIQRELFNRECRKDFQLFCEVVMEAEGRSPAFHHRRIIQELEDVAAGVTERLMMFAPPGSAKSTYTARLFPAWCLARTAKLTMIGASHIQTFSETNSAAIQRVIRDHSDVLGINLLTEAKHRWDTTNLSEYRSVGVAATVTGTRADLIIIDDPIAGREDADSLLQRNKLENWYHSELARRLKPGGRIVMILTRWHEDDIAGRLLRSEGERWKVLRLPALAEEDDPLGRPPGAPLWDDDAYGYAGTLKQIYEGLSSAGLLRDWYALYQGAPRPPEGAMFRPGQIPILDFVVPGSLLDKVRAWDFAASSDGDWTAGVRMCSTTGAQGVDYVVTDCRRFRGRPDEVFRTVEAVANADGFDTKVCVPQDPGSAGVAEAESYIRGLAGYNVIAERASGDKENRAFPCAAQANIGRIGMLRGPWNAELLDEMASFPLGVYDDQIDALSYAFNMVAKPNLAAWMRL